MPTLEESRQRAKDQKLQAHKKSDDMYIVYNPTSKSSYYVYRSESGTWVCTCPYAVKGSRIAAGDCKHLTRVLDKERGCISCNTRDVPLKDGKCRMCMQYEKFV